MRITARVAAALMTTTIVVGSASSAFAESTTVKDKASDVISFADQTSDTRGTQLGYAESIASGIDIRSLRVKHTKKSVALRVKFSNLSGESLPIMGLRLNGASAPTRFVVVADNTKAKVVNTQGTRRCHAPMTVRVGSRGYVDVVIARSCLGNPNRLKASAFAATKGLQGDNAPYLADALSPNSVRGEGWTKWLKSS